MQSFREYNFPTSRMCHFTGSTVHQSLDALDRILNMTSLDESEGRIGELRQRWKTSEREQADWQDDVRQSMARWSLQRARVEVSLGSCFLESGRDRSTGWSLVQRFVCIKWSEIGAEMSPSLVPFGCKLWLDLTSPILERYPPLVSAPRRLSCASC